jgi:hypothetical protein
MHGQAAEYAWQRNVYLVGRPGVFFFFFLPECHARPLTKKHWTLKLAGQPFVLPEEYLSTVHICASK